MEKTAVVVGGSIGGMMNGIMLRRQGYNVTIIEQDTISGRDRLNAGIQVGPNVIRFLQEHNYREYWDKEFYIQSDVSQIIGSDAQEWIRIPGGPKLWTNWRLIMDILLAMFSFDVNLSSMEKNKKPSQTGSKVLTGSRVIGVRDLEKRVEVKFESKERDTPETILADLVIASDGSYSFVRRLLQPDFKSVYVGYVAWRGVVQESFLLGESTKVFEERLTMYRTGKGNYIVLYFIPNEQGETQPGKRLLNWIWYFNLAEGSPELIETMTDDDGKLHHGTVPRGKVPMSVWRKQVDIAKACLPTPISSAVENTAAPFVSRIYEGTATTASFFGNKLLLAGDALVTFRPHIALSTNQAAYHCALLEQLVRGKSSAEQYEGSALTYGIATGRISAVVGILGTSSNLKLPWYIIKFGCLFLWRRIFG